ncbi:glucosaminidase domain-containing protein [Allopusillimonas ginsengisoli]|uniref:glucosaminidase domain-containing protein n=1 Tax=Allopusillimonas ginsengisoli TaxID=453575 RepID=UPI0010210075|nr:glucosaminidase domain-containing protein [Allopusillimonas ginsengisoli]TEA78635.1 hypothetical protein ERE07_09570 [Allopusillimonas ginsengisoli]
MATPLEFATQYMPLAQATGRRLGVSPDILLGQWGLETGWGKSVIPGTHNLGNIKDFSGSGIAAKDNMTGSTDKYRAFETPQAFADHYAGLIERKYPNAVGAGNDPMAYASALKTGGYAEDPDYINKIAAVTQTVRKQPGVMEKITDFFIPSAHAGTLPKDGPWTKYASKPEQDAQGPWTKYAKGPEQVEFMPLNQDNIHTEQPVQDVPKFDAKAAVNESLKLFPDSPDPAQHTKALGAGLAQGLADPALGAEHWLGKGLDLVGADQTGQALVQDAAENRQSVGDWADQYKSQAPFSGGVGRLAGNIASTAPIPGALAGTVSRAAVGSMAPAVGRLAQSIGSGGLRLGSAAGSRAANIATRAAGGAIAGGATAGMVNPDDVGLGATIGAAGPLVLRGAGLAGKAIGNNRTGQVAAQARNAPRLQTIKEATEAGYVIPPSSVHPSMRNTVLESISGKIATAQSASVRNQAITDSLARKALGLPDDVPLTSEMLSQYRKAAYDAGYVPLRQIGPVQTDNMFTQSLDDVVKQYTGKGTIPAMERSEITDLADAYRLNGFDSSDAVDAIRALREAADDAFRKGDGALARANRAIAGALEDQLERAAGAASPDLLSSFRQSRANIAKSHTVEKALREGSGSVDAAKIARELQKGKPLSGELELIGKFASAFPKAAQPAAQVAGPGVSKLASAASTLMAGAGGVAAGPVGIGLGAVPFVVPPMVRSGLLSSAFQKGLSKPVNVKPSQVGGLLSNPQIQQMLNRTMPLLSNQ